MEEASLILLRKVSYPPLGDRPVEILESRLYQDPQTLQISLSLAMQNVGEKPVNAVYLDLCGFDEDVQLVVTKNRVPYTHLQADAGGVFGADVRIPLASLRVRSITATLHHVVFQDGSIWSAKETTPAKEFSDMPNTLSSGRKKKGKRRRLLAWLAILLLLGGGTAFTLAYQHQLSQKAILADSLFASGQYTDALPLYQELATTINPFANRADYRYQQALCHIRQGEWAEAVSLLHADPNHTPSLRLLRQVNTLLSGIVSAGETHSVAVCSNGTAYAAGDNSMGQCQVDAWQNLVAVAAGSHHTLGLTQNGSVLYAGTADAPYGQVEEWRHAVSIAAGETHSVAALSNGRVVAVGDNSFGQCDTKGWSGVIAVAAGKNHTVALRLDGTVIADGDNPSGGCNVEGWQDVISIAAGDGFTLGIDKHGSLLVAGAFDAPEVSDLTAVFAGKKHGIVRTKEGTLLAGGDNSQHQGEVGRWENLFTAAGGGGHSLAITPEGTGVAIGQNTHGQCNVTNWTGIGVPPSALHLCGIASEY